MAKNAREITSFQDSIKPTAEWSKERTLLNRLVREEGTLVSEVAKAIGKSRSAVSLYISNKYQANSEFETSVRDYLIHLGRWQREEEKVQQEETAAGQSDFPPHRRTTPKDLRIMMIQTDDMSRVWGICRKSHENKEFGMIIGNPGTGKTFALNKYRDVASIPMEIITCDQTSTVKSILVDTAEALDLEVRGSSATLMRRIVKELQRRPRLLVYDEADLLKGARIFETIRAIYDKSEIGMVICGNQNLAERILSYAEDRPEMARIRDRIGYFTSLSGLTEQEARMFLNGVNVTREAAELLVKIGLKRGIRQLVNALGRLLEVTNGDLITAELVEDLGQIVLSFNS